MTRTDTPDHGWRDIASASNDADQYECAVSAVRRSNKASVSNLQRCLQIGFNKAASLIERMETEGIVSAPDKHGARTIISTASSPTISAARGEDDAAFRHMLVCALAFTDWAAGEGVIPDRQVACEPSDIIADYAEAIGLDLEKVPIVEHARGMLARRGAQSSQPARWEWSQNGEAWSLVAESTRERAVRAAAEAGIDNPYVRPLYASPPPAPAPSAAPGEMSDAEILRCAAQEACDLLAELKHGNPARSPGHNARLLLKDALQAAKVRPQAARGDNADVLAERETIAKKLDEAAKVFADCGGNINNAVASQLRAEALFIRVRSALHSETSR